MLIGLFFGVYEAEKAFAQSTLEQALGILESHDVHVLILDDASPSHVGETLALAISGKPRVSAEVVRIEQSSGFRGSMDRTLLALRHLANRSEPLDYVVRVDADLFFGRTDLSAVFDSSQLPRTGMVGCRTVFRWRDYVQVLGDLAPLGFRRRHERGVITHTWELARMKPVWWSDIGWRALGNGFGRSFLNGPFQVISGQSLSQLKEKGWLDRSPSAGLGLVFGEDVMTNVLIKALGHPLTDFSEILDDWSCDMFVQSEKCNARDLFDRKHYLIHPLKGDARSQSLREELLALQAGKLSYS